MFSRLDVQGYTTVCLQWVKPHKHDTLRTYGIRLAEQIDSSRPFYLLGVSLGGMLAVEIANYLKPIKTVIISSVATANELPWHLKLAASLHIDYITPAELLKSANPLSYWIFGTDTKEEKKLLKDILADIDPRFMKWALRAIANWDNSTIPPNLVRIHGTSDKVLPMFSTADAIKIGGGGHMMIYNNAAELSKIIAKQLLTR